MSKSEKELNESQQSVEKVREEAVGERYTRPFWQRALKNILISALVFDTIFAIFFVLTLSRVTKDPAPGMGGRVLKGLLGFTIWAAVVGFGCTGYKKPSWPKVLILLLLVVIACWVIISTVAIPISGIRFADEESKYVMTFIGVVFCLIICSFAQLTSVVPFPTNPELKE
jgi:hypothetical protein